MDLNRVTHKERLISYNGEKCEPTPTTAKLKITSLNARF